MGRTANELLKKEMGEQEYNLHFKAKIDACVSAASADKECRQIQKLITGVSVAVSACVAIAVHNKQLNFWPDACEIEGVVLIIAYVMNRCMQADRMYEQGRFQYELDSLRHCASSENILLCRAALDELELNDATFPSSPDQEGGIRAVKSTAREAAVKLLPYVLSFFG